MLKGKSLSNIKDLYGDYQKLQRDISNYKLQIIELEGKLISEKDIYASKERNYQRQLQDLEHYKLKNVIDKPDCKDSDSEDMDIDFVSIFSNNEELIKHNLDLVLKSNRIERQIQELTHKNDDLQIELSKLEESNSNLIENNNELKSYVEEKKGELLEMNSLKRRIKELENTNKDNSLTVPISFNVNKVNELELKCFKLEQSNERLKKNHANLMLLEEENAALSSQNERLKLKLEQYECFHYTEASDQNSISNIDVSAERKNRHVEKENEILKCQQAQSCEENAVLKTKIISLEQNLKLLTEKNDNYNVLVYEKENRIALLENEIGCLTKDCESYKHVLENFTDQSNLDNDTLDILSGISTLYEAIEEHKLELDERTGILNQLIQVVANYVDESKDNSNQDDFLISSNNDSDRKMIVELRKEVERLTDELQNQMDKVQEFQDRYNILVRQNEQRRSGDYIDESVFQDSECRKVSRDVNMDLFKKLNRSLLDSVRILLGYYIEVGPNGNVTLQNCLSEDATEVLEFKIDDNVVLIDNAYSQQVLSQRDFNGSYPALLASITLDMISRISQL